MRQELSLLIEEIKTAKKLDKKQNSVSPWQRTDIPSFDKNKLNSLLLNEAKSIESKNDFLMTLLQHFVSITQSYGALFFHYNTDKKLVVGPQLLSKDLLANEPDILGLLNETASRSFNSDSALELSTKQHLCVFSPVKEAEISGVLVNFFSSQQKLLAQRKTVSQLMPAFISVWGQAKQSKQLYSESFFSMALLELITSIQGMADDADCYSALVTQTQSVVQSDRVGFVEYNKTADAFKFAALSEISDADKRNNLSTIIEQCAYETYQAEEDISLSGEQLSDMSAPISHVRLAELVNAESVYSLVLQNDDHILGSLVFWWNKKPEKMDLIERFLDVLKEPLSSTLLTRKSIGKNRLFQNQNNVFHRYRKQIISGLAVFMLVMSLLPVSYKIKPDVVIKPVTQRVVSATTKGVLKSVQVSPGDAVKSGQVLAKLDDEEIRLELQALKAEYSGASKRRSLQMLNESASETQIAELNAQQIAYKIQLMTKRMKQLNIVSPVNGYVISGGINEKEGTPVEKGQALFEVAPLDQMKAEIAIPENDIVYVKPGMPVSIYVHALPNKKWSAKIDSIQPKSTIRNGSNVFLGKVAITDNPELLLKSGMQGKAVLAADKRSIGWILFHKAYYQLKTWLLMLFTSPG